MSALKRLCVPKTKFYLRKQAGSFDNWILENLRKTKIGFEQPTHYWRERAKSEGLHCTASILTVKLQSPAQCSTGETINKQIHGTEIDPHQYSQLISDKGAEAIQQSRERIFNKLCCNHWTFTCKNKLIQTDTISFKSNSKCMTNINVK